jgi:peroxiredoxin
MRMTLAFILLCVGGAVAQDDSSSAARFLAHEEFVKLQREENESSEPITKTGVGITNQKWQAHCKEFSEKYRAHAKKYPNDTSAVDALLKVITLSKHVDPELHANSLALLRRDYLKTPLVVHALRNLGLETGKLDLLREIAETNSSKLVRAMAWRALINGRSTYVGVYRQMLRTEETREKPDARIVAQFTTDVAGWEQEIAEAKAKLQSPELANVLPDLSVGAKAPTTVSVDMSSKKVSLADHKGKVILLDFWDTQCGPCKKMIPATNALIQEMKGRPFVVVAISGDASKADLVTFHLKTKMLGEQWWAGNDAMLWETWNVEAVPTICVIDHKGIISHHQRGYDEKADKIAELVKELVKKAEAAR